MYSFIFQNWLVSHIIYLYSGKIIYKLLNHRQKYIKLINQTSFYFLFPLFGLSKHFRVVASWEVVFLNIEVFMLMFCLFRLVNVQLFLLLLYNVFASFLETLTVFSCFFLQDYMSVSMNHRSNVTGALWNLCIESIDSMCIYSVIAKKLIGHNVLFGLNLLRNSVKEEKYRALIIRKKEFWTSQFMFNRSASSLE